MQWQGRVIEGSVVVAKNPCLHIGDVRVLRAVLPGNDSLLQVRPVSTSLTLTLKWCKPMTEATITWG